MPGPFIFLFSILIPTMKKERGQLSIKGFDEYWIKWLGNVSIKNCESS